MQRRRVLLPEPLAPIMLTTFARCTSKETPLRTSSAPNFLWTSTTLMHGGSLIRRTHCFDEVSRGGQLCSRATIVGQRRFGNSAPNRQAMRSPPAEIAAPVED